MLKPVDRNSSLFDWIGFLTLNIGNPVVEAVPMGTRIFFWIAPTIAVRNARFQVVPLAVVAPAVKYVLLCYFPREDTYAEWWLIRVLYLITMHIAVYPNALRQGYNSQSRTLPTFDFDRTEQRFVESGISAKKLFSGIRCPILTS